MGLGLQQWVAGLIFWVLGHTLMMFAAKRDPDFAPVLARHLRQKGELSC
jgi:type IV secretion system protein VirB3